MPPADARRSRLVVLADDLTGAADAAAPFAVRGLDVSVALAGDPSPDVDVLALVTDNRWRPAEEAAVRMRAAVERVRGRRPDLFFLKVDSTLRGRVRADVRVALDAWGSRNAVATPAFPAQGRTVHEGALLVHGRTTVDDITAHFPAGVRVVDARTHDDLLRIARDVLDDGAVAVGSGGLARALADVLVPTPGPRRVPALTVTGVLLVVGTTHAATLDQVTVLLEAGADRIVVDGRAPWPVEAAARALRDGRRVILTSEVAEEVAADSAEAAALAEHLARVVAAIVADAPSVGLVLTGGATALAVSAALGAEELRLLSEVTEGLPLGELLAGDRRIPVVTKSGGFGTPNSLNRAAEALEECA
ncbi:four-carbon acid sugar kinase family protein [Blastococcus sp. SYSU DS0510]